MKIKYEQLNLFDFISIEPININILYDEAYKIVSDAIGEENIGHVTKVSANTRAKSRWGCCKSDNGGKSYKLEIAERLLQGDADYNQVLSTMVHEILHTCKGSHHHDAVWQNNAYRVMQKYPYLKISRTNSAADFNIKNEREEYAIECEKCGYVYKTDRKRRCISKPWNYIHNGCGGKFKKIY